MECKPPEPISGPHFPDKNDDDDEYKDDETDHATYDDGFCIARRP